MSIYMHHKDKKNGMFPLNLLVEQARKSGEDIDHYWMKKWNVHYDYLDEKGRHIQFRGWLNTNALHKDDFPERIEGTFWADLLKDEEHLYNGRYLMRGRFDFGLYCDDPVEFCTFGYVYPVYLEESVDYANNPTREGADAILRSTKPLDFFSHFEARIEDCLVDSYCMKIDLAR